MAALAAKLIAADGEDDQGLMDAELDRLGDLQQALELIAQTVHNVARLRARDAIESSRDKTSEYYGALSVHPCFDRLRIDVQEKLSSGVAKNNYVVKVFSSQDGTDTTASTRLSMGQMNCVALSISLGLHRALTHNLGFVILDDPIQNLDSKHRAALATLLSRVAHESQVIIATEDEELDGLLSDVMKDPGSAEIPGSAARLAEATHGSGP